VHPSPCWVVWAIILWAHRIPIIGCRPNRPLACGPLIFPMISDGWPFLKVLSVVEPSSSPHISLVD
jgi:hypothetical protein